MQSQIIVAAIQGGSQIITKIMDKRPGKMPPMQSESPEDALDRIYGGPKERTPVEAPVAEVIVTDVTEEDTPKKPAGTSCIPCGLSHVATCAGELNEAVRFAREDVASEEVSKRIAHCLTEIAACERIDLAPQNIVGLDPEKKALVDTMATEIRDIRHGLEWYKTKEDIEELAAKTSNLYEKIHKGWLKIRLKALSPEQLSQVKAKVQERLGEGFGNLLDVGEE